VRRRVSLAEVALVVAVAAWGSNYAVMRYALQHGFETLVMQCVRWSLASVLYVAIVWKVEGGIRLARRDLRRLVALSAVGLGATQIANAYSLRLAPASTVALVFGLLPVVIAIFAQAFGIERLRARHWFGAAVSVGGVALIAVGRGGTLGGTLGGILLSVLTVLAFGAFTVALFPLSGRITPLTLNTVSVVVSAFVVLACGAATGQIARQDWSAPGPLAWAAVVASAVVSLVIGNGLWFWAQKRVGPGRSGLYANLQPVFGVLFALALLGETLSGLEIVGGLVVGVGIALARSRRAAPAP